MKRKKKGLSPLKRVLLCSWCVLGLLSAIFLIKWAINLSPETPEDGIGSFAQSGNGESVVQQEGEPTKAPNPTATPAPSPTPLPRAEFVKEYPHMGVMTEFYAYTEGVAYGFRYPCYEANTSEGAVVANAVADAAHQLMAEKVTELAKVEGSEKFLLIDYEDGETEGLLSVLFYIEKEVDGVKTTETSCWIYNKKKGETVDPETLFGDRAYLYAAQQVNELLAEKDDASEEPGGATEGTTDEVAENYKFTGAKEEFPAYLLTAEGVKFYYEGEGTEGFVVIPYIAVHTYMAVTENGTVRADNIRELDPDKPMIALTFDDGPHYQNTPHLLEILEQYNVKSTFFVLGDRSHFSESNKKTVTMVAEAGHEIASHTYSHKDLKSLSKDALIDEVVKARENIYALTGEYPTYVRPPYGGYNDLVKEYVYAPMINWDLDSKDWSFRNVDQIVEHVLKEVENKNIILMHDIHWFTVDSVERLLPELAARGYQFVTVSELFYYNNVEKINGKVYYGGYN